MTETLAKMYYATESAYLEARGEKPRKPWDNATLRQKEQTIALANWALGNPEGTIDEAGEIGFKGDITQFRLLKAIAGALRK